MTNILKIHSSIREVTQHFGIEETTVRDINKIEKPLAKEDNFETFGKYDLSSHLHLVQVWTRESWSR